MLIYFLKGGLPWQGIKAYSTFEKYRAIGATKMVYVDKIYHGLPSEFYEYYSYVRDLDFDEEPNYQALRNIFRGLFNQRGFEKISNKN